MTPSKPTRRPRRKACDACSDAKIRCDHNLPTCTRCRQRNLSCSYPGNSSPRRISNVHRGNAQINTPSAGSQQLGEDATGLPTPRGSARSTSVSHPVLGQSLYRNELTPSLTQDYNSRPPGQTDSDLVCTIDAGKIQNRWLHAFIPEANSHEKRYSSGVISYMTRVLRSYTAMVVNATGVPPFIHPTQVQESTCAKPLANCLSLLRICDKRLPSSADLAVELIEREMRRLSDEQGSYDGHTLCAAFQAYLLYTMTLVFHLNQTHQHSLQLAVMTLQDLACAVASHGVITRSELSHARPDWQSWVLVEAKRRTLYTMYLLDNILCIQENLPIFLATELQGLPAPGHGSLWRACGESEWRVAYNAYLSQWPTRGLTIDELWPVPSGLNADETHARKARGDKWLEGADEFGMMLSAVMICTHDG